jgi:acetoin utilization protein AcuB
MHRIPVRQIMQTTVVTIHPEALVADAAQILEEFHIRRLPVVNEEGCLVGIVTNSDIREAEAVSSVGNPYEPAAEQSWLAVGDVMTREVVTVEPTATVGQLAVKLMEHKISGLPVVEQEDDNLHLVGIVSETDIFRMIADAWEQSQVNNGQNG